MYSYDRTSESKTARQEGPLRKQLDEHWNTLHDIETSLETAEGPYDIAASYAFGPGTRDAQEILREITKVKAIIKSLAAREFDRLSDLEAAFIAKHGTPEEYRARMQDQMGLR